MRKQRTHLNVECLETRQVPAALLGGYTPAQISHAYGFDQMWVNGAGETIAIVDPYDDPRIGSDLTQFDQAFGIPDPPSFTKVDQFGGTHFSWNDSSSAEISLDVEWAHAMAPAANILLVEANSATDADLDTAVDYARNQPGVVAVSMSYGHPEDPLNPATELARDIHFTTPAGHIGGYGLPGGITFVAATGDSGWPGAYPAYSPNVLAVGGTTLFADGAGNYLGEVGWSLGSDPDPTWGGGGGTSFIEPEPPYQMGVQATGMRTIPDVSYNADPLTGFCVYNTETANGWTVMGGTSAGAPQWAALVALADQGRTVLTGAGSLDGPTQTLPALYSPQMAGDFNDITVGWDGVDFAGPGYDLVTGLGTPWAPWVASDLAMAGLPPAPGGSGAARQSLFAKPADGIVPSLTARPLENPEGLIPASASLKVTADALFADWSQPAVTTPKSDARPIEIVLVDHRATHEAHRTPEAHSNHTKTADRYSLDLGSLSVLGLDRASSLWTTDYGLRTSIL
jgi:hypothetical protein